MLGEPVSMGVESDLDRADTPGDEARLPRTHHAYGEVGVAPEDIRFTVRQDEFERQTWVRGVNARQDHRNARSGCLFRTDLVAGVRP